MKLNPGSGYDQSFQRTMDSYLLGLAEQPKLITTLLPDKAKAILRYLLELCCQAQNIRNIELGRTALCEIPIYWLGERIQAAVEKNLTVLEDEWEYRRLGEVYLKLLPQLVPGYIELGLNSANPEVQEAARDFAEGPPQLEWA